MTVNLSSQPASQRDRSTDDKRNYTSLILRRHSANPSLAPATSPSFRLLCQLLFYLLRPKAARHSITITKTEEKHKKLTTKIHKN